MIETTNDCSFESWLPPLWPALLTVAVVAWSEQSTADEFVAVEHQRQTAYHDCDTGCRALVYSEEIGSMLS